MKKDRKQKRKIVFRVVVAFVLLALVIIIAAAAIKTRNDLSVANVITTMVTMWERSEEADEFEFERSADIVYIDGEIATVSDGGIRTYNKEGNENLVSAFTMDEPILATNGELMLVYDIGGHILKLFDMDNIVREIETEQPIISADINRSGWITLCTQESSYTSSVTVYNAKGTAVYRWSSGEGYILSAKVYDDNKTLAVITLRESGTDFVKFELRSEEESGRLRLQEQVILDFGIVDGKTVLITDSGVIFLDEDGERKAEYDFGGRLLSDYTIASGRDVLVVLSSDSLQTQQEIVLIKADGRESAKITAEAKVIDTSSYRNKYAVLTEDGAVVYNEKLEEKAVFDDAEGEKIIALDDGIMAAGEYLARIFK